MKILFASLRIAAVTLLVCCVAYPLVILAAAKVIAPASAEGSLVRAADGTVVGSRQVAQAFTQPRYFWPRPSAVDYNGTGAGGSNLSPASPALAERARETLASYGTTTPIPADLVTASGSGLDPHISLAGAQYQASRVAAARGLPEERVRELIETEAQVVGASFAPERIVNVLEINVALDQLDQLGPQR